MSERLKKMSKGEQIAYWRNKFLKQCAHSGRLKGELESNREAYMFDRQSLREQIRYLAKRGKEE